MAEILSALPSYMGVLIKGFRPILRATKVERMAMKSLALSMPSAKLTSESPPAAGQQLHHHQNGVDPEADGDNPVSQAEAFDSVHGYCPRHNGDSSL